MILRAQAIGTVNCANCANRAEKTVRSSVRPTTSKRIGWGGRIRTGECRYQKQVPYRLATPHQSARLYDSPPITQPLIAFAPLRTRNLWASGVCAKLADGVRPIRTPARQATMDNLNPCLPQRMPEVGTAKPPLRVENGSSTPRVRRSNSPLSHTTALASLYPCLYPSLCNTQTDGLYGDAKSMT